MTVNTNPSQKKVNAAEILHFLFITGALRFDIGSIAIEDVYVFTLNIDMIEKVFPHKGVVTLGMIFRNPDIFIHIKGNDMFKRNFSGPVKSDQFPVNAKGR